MCGFRRTGRTWPGRRCGCRSRSCRQGGPSRCGPAVLPGRVRRAGGRHGDAILNGLDWAAQAFAPLNQTRDLVFVEQRGTPGSGLGQWARQCAAVPACARAYHPAADLATVLAHLKAHPARVSLPRPGFTAAGPQTVTITVPLFLNIVAENYLGSSLTAVLLPADLHALAHGQWQQVIGKRGYTTANLLPAAGPVSLQGITINCSDAWAAINPAKVRHQTGSVFDPAFTPAQAEARQALCAIWPHDPGASGTVHSAIPAAFLNGTADPTDPPANVAAATRTMPGALLVSVPATAHWVLSQTLDPSCLLNATTAFIQSGRPARPAAWAACTRTLAHQPPLLSSP